MFDDILIETFHDDSPWALCRVDSVAALPSKRRAPLASRGNCQIKSKLIRLCADAPRPRLPPGVLRGLAAAVFPAYAPGARPTAASLRIFMRWRPCLKFFHAAAPPAPLAGTTSISIRNIVRRVCACLNRRNRCQPKFQVNFISTGQSNHSAALCKSNI